METNFNFKSQICTSRSQSERLLSLGLKQETADMAMCYMTHDLSGKEIEPEFLGYTSEPMPCEERQTVLCSRQKFIPAWSLHRLIEMIYPTDIYIDILSPVILPRENIYDYVIERIERKIKEGYFNKEYLEE